MAAETGISRRCLAKWCARRRAQGENGLLGHSSRPGTSIYQLASSCGGPAPAKSDTRTSIPRSTTNSGSPTARSAAAAVLLDPPLPHR
ncbi:helix-turn-helix domain-containing protein [Streptomyces canus]|uniref:helix-turn-helix domain-containing protein n=1 Tax=Streptomyces canus TaxID=58343 RepID=UPI0036C76FE7